MVKIVGVIGEICLHDVWPAVAIEVGGIDSHSRLFSPVGAVSNARLCADFGESAFTVVVVKQTRRRIVRHIEIEASIFVVVEPQHAEPVIPIRIHAEFFRNVSKGPVAIIVKEPVARAFQSPRTAIHRDPAILTERAVTELRQIVDI